MVPPSPPSHLEGVAQGKHIDGGDVRRLAGRPRAFGNAIAVFARERAPIPTVTRPEETLDTTADARASPRERRDFQSGLPGAAALHRRRSARVC
jgi:hypothetical protein